MDVLRFFDALLLVAEQVIKVPKIIFEDIPTRIFREPQLAEQLVEVPTILYFLRQKVDIPVPRGGGRFADLQGFHPEQSSTAPQFVEQIVDIPVSGGSLRGFRPAASSSSSHSPAGVLEDADEPFEGFFRTSLPGPINVRGSPRRRVRSWVRTRAHPR